MGVSLLYSLYTSTRGHGFWLNVDKINDIFNISTLTIALGGAHDGVFLSGDKQQLIFPS